MYPAELKSKKTFTWNRCQDTLRLHNYNALVILVIKVCKFKKINCVNFCSFA